MEKICYRITTGDDYEAVKEWVGKNYGDMFIRNTAEGKMIFFDAPEEVNVANCTKADISNVSNADVIFNNCPTLIRERHSKAYAVLYMLKFS